MGEYLDLRSTLSDKEISDYLNQHLPQKLAARLDVAEGQVSTKLAIGTDVHTTFDEMVALYGLVRDGPFRYGSGHEYNATPEEILKTWSALYLGAWEERGKRPPGSLITGDLLDVLEHRDVWRKTKRTLSKNGNWYHRKVHPDETSGVRGNPNGYRAPCPNNDDGPFRAAKVGFAWDYEHNLGRDLYRCKPCGLLFNIGEYETPQYADLAATLSASTAEQNEQVDNLEGGAMLYHVLRPNQPGIGIDHVVDGAIARAEKDDALDAARYLITVADDCLEPLTLQHERESQGCKHTPLTMDELEGFAQLYNGAYQFKHSREQ